MKLESGRETAHVALHDQVQGYGLFPLTHRLPLLQLDSSKKAEGSQMHTAVGAEGRWRRKGLGLTAEPQFSWAVEAIFVLFSAMSDLEKAYAREGLTGPSRGSPGSVKSC